MDKDGTQFGKKTDFSRMYEREYPLWRLHVKRFY